MEDFEKAVEPAIKWLNENVNPHNYIIISPTSAELVEGQKMTRTYKFIKD